MITAFLEKRWGINQIYGEIEKPKLYDWKKYKRGTWIINVASVPEVEGQGHCVILKEGKLIDNNASYYWTKYKADRNYNVSQAWQLKEPSHV